MLRQLEKGLLKNVKAKVPKKCPFLSPNNIKNRKDFARKQVSWPSSKWRSILWSDETKINLFGSDALKKNVRRLKKKESDPRYTVKTVKHGGGNIKNMGLLFISWSRSPFLDQRKYEQRNIFKYTAGCYATLRRRKPTFGLGLSTR